MDLTDLSQDWVTLGHCLPGAKLLTDEKGVCETYRGIIEVDGRRTAAYIKFLPARQLVNELLGSTLARMVGIRSPRAYLVKVVREEYSASEFSKGMGEPEFLAFATEAINAPAIGRCMNIGSPDAIRELWNQWKDWPTAACFDTWIANRDRHWQNLLLAAPGEVWLIDHGYAFTGPSWVIDNLKPEVKCGNKLCNYAKANVPDGDRSAAGPGINEIAQRFAATNYEFAIKTSKAQPYLTGDEVKHLAEFLCQRAKDASKTTMELLGIPELNLGVAS